MKLYDMETETTYQYVLMFSQNLEMDYVGFPLDNPPSIEYVEERCKELGYHEFQIIENKSITKKYK